MSTSLDAGLLSRLCDFVSSRMALQFPRERWGELERKVGAAAREFGHADGAAFVEWLLSTTPSREQIEILASHLTIGETYFWREPQVFEALEGQILPELIRARGQGERRLRIWSAGCATGEEPYSIAMAVCRALPKREDWNISILATDINPLVLRRAAAGVYGGWSFRNAPRWLKACYFTRREDRKHELSPKIRSMVTFAYLNLAEDIYPSPVNNTNAMDIIFCRNVLMYFSPERVRKVGESLFHSLVPDGWLMVSATELSQDLFPRFVPIHSHGAIVYRRDRRESQRDVRDSGEERRSFRPPPSLPETETFLPTTAIQTPPPVFFPIAPPLEVPAAVVVPAAAPRAGAAAAIPAAPACPGAAEVRALANRGQLAQALATCEAAIAGNKVDPGLQYLAAVILQELDRKLDAVAAFRRALYLDPDFVLAYFSLGNLLLHQEKVKAARKCFENVVALLAGRLDEEVLPESEGLTAGRLRQIVHATLEAGALT
ncbi:MAG: CheR family methyltransferase [Candidatus Methylomirabilia bacterium]